MKKIIVFCLLFVSAKAQNIVKMEYFIDNDPGIGAATNVLIASGSTVNHNFSFPLSSLSNGIHLLNIRCRDQNNFWSLTNTKAFYKESISSPLPLSNIVKIEYFIDNDTGTGSGVDVPITAGTSIINHAFSFPVSSLTDGIHLVSVRAKDANNLWSLVQTRAFYKQSISSPAALPYIVKMEYFIDNDPGTGGGIDVPITPATSLSNIGFSFNVSAISDGIHMVSVRTRDAKNVWSIVKTNAFYKQTIVSPPALSNIAKLEYFIDNDPGYDLGIPLSFTQGISLTTNFTATLASLSVGTHKITIRAKDANNRWGVVSIKDFDVANTFAIVGSTPPNYCRTAAFNIPFTAVGTYNSGNVFVAQLSNASGSFASPTTLGTLAGTTSGTITATIPNSISLGSGYQIRVVTSNPSLSDNPSVPITVVAVCPPPCPTSLTLASTADDYSSGILIKEVNASTGIIVATNKITNTASVTYRAGKSITLNAGFKADNGVVFKTEFGGCN